jgi:hypothetical protein
MCDLPLVQIKFSLVPISITSFVSLSPLDDLIIRDKVPSVLRKAGEEALTDRRSAGLSVAALY